MRTSNDSNGEEVGDMSDTVLTLTDEQRVEWRSLLREAYDALNQLRARAGLFPVPMPSTLTRE